MSLAPSPSTSRGGITVQPSYFTSSLFVHPLREDILHLINVYSEQYLQTKPTQPFALFKTIWTGLGWTWMHFKVFDTRSRDTFLRVTSRLFLERMVDTEPPFNRVVALFGLYTFFCTQPTTKTPSLHAISYMEVPIDWYTSLLSLPKSLTENLIPLKPHAVSVLSALVKSQVFYILPASTLHPLNPRDLPREIFVKDGYEFLSTQDPESQITGSTVPELPLKKKGRPSKRDKKGKAIKALQQVDKWLEKNSITVQPRSPDSTPGPDQQATDTVPLTTHVLMSHPPTATLNNYRAQKSQLLEAIAPELETSEYAPISVEMTEKTPAREALERANKSVLARLKRLDEMAAEKGLEVGGEGGDRTGLQRVEKAVAELHNSDGTLGPRGGILGLLEGGGIAPGIDSDLSPDVELSP